MNTSALKSMMRLFSLTANLTSVPSIEKTGLKVKAYLSQLTNPEEAANYYNMFEFYFNQVYSPEKDFLKRYSLFSVKAIILSHELLPLINREQRIILITLLFEIIEIDTDERDYLTDFIETISSVFSIEKEVSLTLRNFSFNESIPVEQNNILLVSHRSPPDYKGRFASHKHVYGKIFIVSIPETEIFLFKIQDFSEQLTLNGKSIMDRKIYFMSRGDSLLSHKFKPLHFGDVVKHFALNNITPVILTARKAKYLFPDNTPGIHSFDLCEEKGQLIGILGSSGVGKTTFLNLLNGNLKPANGHIWLNGFDIHAEKELIRSQIGYVPQDDLLISELTVYQNMHFNARLCFGNLTSHEIDNRIDAVLKSLGLNNIRHLKVGDPLNKVISGGQRKRLNIAMELLREPSLLLLDEPTSGLSSSDSEKVMDLLKSLSLKGKLIIANIHQPSSRIFKMFDKIIILDKGGYLIYQGEPLDAGVFFKEFLNETNASERECISCGNVNAEQILKLIEQKKIEPNGSVSNERLLSPYEWQSNFNSYNPAIVEDVPEKKELPETGFSLPGVLKQFKIFTQRNLATKLQDKQYLLVSLIEAPILALILGYFTRYVAGASSHSSSYVFMENENLPVFFIMTVIVALFLGLVISAEQIIQDKRILERERFLALNKTSYYNAKILFVFALSAIQMLLYVSIANPILGIRGMGPAMWLVLFSIAANANLMGLIISANLKSLVAIYVLIPLLLVPQLLLNGSAIKFDKLPPSMRAEKTVPWIGESMIARWAYESLMVYQFKHNRFQKHFFTIDRKISEASFHLNYRIPEIELALTELKPESPKPNTRLEFILHETEILDNYLGQKPSTEKLRADLIKGNKEPALKLMKTYKTAVSGIRNQYNNERDQKIESLRNRLNRESVITLKENNLNQRVNNIVTADDESKKYTIASNEIIQHSDPIYRKPARKNGRAHFFAPEKSLGKLNIPTYWFNLLAIWLFNLILFLVLIGNIFRKINIFGFRFFIFAKQKIINFLSSY